MVAPNIIFGTPESDTLTGTLDLDLFFGLAGDDTIDAQDGNDAVFAGGGNDTVYGGLGDDALFGGVGNDQLEGGKGNDFMFGGAGNDILDWDDGDGSDIISGGSGRDTVKVDGSLARGDNFVLGTNEISNAFFERVGLDGESIGKFSLTVDTSEVFAVSGEGGDDTFTVNDLNGTGVNLVTFNGGEGNDSVDATNTYTKVKLDGGVGNDSLVGGWANEVLTGGEGQDTLTGGYGRDRFVYAGHPFANGTATPAPNGINVLATPDQITDFDAYNDIFVLNGNDLGLTHLQFVEGNANQIGDGNVINLTNGFANAAAAAQAIADNDTITAGAGVFLYFNTSLGFSRLVYSNDLANGGDISILANLTNQTDLGNQNSFAARNVALG